MPIRNLIQEDVDKTQEFNQTNYNEIRNPNGEVLEYVENLSHLKNSIEQILGKEVFMPQVLKVKDFIMHLGER